MERISWTQSPPIWGARQRPYRGIKWDGAKFKLIPWERIGESLETKYKQEQPADKGNNIRNGHGLESYANSKSVYMYNKNINIFQLSGGNSWTIMTRNIMKQACDVNQRLYNIDLKTTCNLCICNFNPVICTFKKILMSCKEECGPQRKIEKPGEYEEVATSDEPATRWLGPCSYLI